MPFSQRFFKKKALQDNWKALHWFSTNLLHRRCKQHNIVSLSGIFSATKIVYFYHKLFVVFNYLFGDFMVMLHVINTEEQDLSQGDPPHQRMRYHIIIEIVVTTLLGHFGKLSDHFFVG